MLNDTHNSIKKVHDVLSKAHETLQKENNAEEFDRISEFILHQCLDHFGKEATQEAIISILSYWRRSDFENLLQFIKRIEQFKT